MGLKLSGILTIGLFVAMVRFGICAPASVPGPMVALAPVPEPAAVVVAATGANAPVAGAPGATGGPAAAAPGTGAAALTSSPVAKTAASKAHKGRALGLLTITVEGDHVTYSTNGKKVSAQGNVKVTAQASGLAGERVTIGADELTADLKAGTLNADRGVSVRVNSAEMVGDRLEYSAFRNELTLSRAKCALSLRPNADTGAIVRAYAFGDEATRHGDVVYVIKGRITTCDRDDPDWSLQARKITYDAGKDVVSIEHPAFQLGHWRIPLPLSYSRSIATEREVSTSILTTPGYSKRDGLFLPYYLQFGPQNAGAKADLDIRFTAKRGLRGLFNAERGDYPWRFRFAVSREEFSDTVLQNFLAVSRQPEVSVTRLLRPTDSNSALSVSLSAGRIRERNLDLETIGVSPPTIKKDRLALVAHYLDGQVPQRRHLGAWWGLTGSKFWYDGSESYSSLAVQVGGGVRLGNKSKVGLTLIRNFDSGVTPLLEDQVQIYREAQPYFDLRIAPRWAVEGVGRYDWGSSELRDYTVKLRHISHCISWVAGYRMVGHHFTIGMELNGITNDVEDYHPKPLLPPLPPESKPSAAPQK